MTQNILIVAGPRDFKDKTKVMIEFARVFADLRPILVISGGATGVDTFVKQFCEDLCIPFKEFPADWEKYGKRAGPIRNEEMAKVGTHLLAFYNGSKGTSNMIKIAKLNGISVKLVEV